MGDSSDFSNTYVIELTGKIMVVAIIILFIVVVFLFSLHLYAKLFWCRRQENPSTAVTTSRRRRQEPTLVSTLTHGLDPTLLKTLPVIMFDPNEFEDGLECSVCLSEVSKGEKTRLLPKCNHGFHLDCIDMWFTSHSTCPLCRHPVSYRKESDPRDESVIEDVVLVENPNFPTNVLFWGDESRVSAFGPCLDEENRISSGSEPSSSSSSSSLLSSSSSSTSDRFNGVIVIDVPRQINEEEEQKSPIPTRLRSLKRLLSGNRRVINPSSPRNLDIEQGNRAQS